MWPTGAVAIELVSLQGGAAQPIHWVTDMPKLKNYPLGEVVAERELTFVASDGPTYAVVVRHGKPVHEDDSWVAPYEIASPHWSKRYAAAGEDSAQALVHSLCIIPDELSALERQFTGRFTWLGMKSVGYPQRPSLDTDDKP